MNLKIRTMGLAALTGAALLLASAPAFADVTYQFSGIFQGSVYSAPNASFSITLPDFVTSDETFTAQQSHLSCGDNLVQCTGVSFLTDSGQDVVTINFATGTASETENYTFDPAVFATDGQYIQNTGFFSNTGTLTVSGVPAVSAAPEPSTWALMLAGIGGMGLLLRRPKKAMSQLGFARR